MEAQSPDPSTAVAYRDPHSATTRFFRNKPQLAELTRRVIPTLFPPNDPLSLLVIGGSVGCEAVSLAASLMQAEPARPFTILSTDRQADVLDHAREARYTYDYFLPIYGDEGGTPPDVRDRWFVRHADRSDPFNPWYTPRPDLMAHLAYAPFDLLASDLPGAFDVVVCQNILTHLQPDAARKALDRAIDCLKPTGVLLCAGMDLGLRSHIPTRGLAPWTGSIDAIHDAWASHRMHFRENRGKFYFELEDLDRSRPDWEVRYGSIFTRKGDSRR